MAFDLNIGSTLRHSHRPMRSPLKEWTALGRCFSNTIRTTCTATSYGVPSETRRHRNRPVKRGNDRSRVTSASEKLIFAFFWFYKNIQHSEIWINFWLHITPPLFRNHSIWRSSLNQSSWRTDELWSTMAKFYNRPLKFSQIPWPSATLLLGFPGRDNILGIPGRNNILRSQGQHFGDPRERQHLGIPMEGQHPGNSWERQHSGDFWWGWNTQDTKEWQHSENSGEGQHPREPQGHNLGDLNGLNRFHFIH